MSDSTIVRVPFRGSEILTVDVAGKPHIILKTAYEAIGIDADKQIKKVQGQPWASTSVTAVQVWYGVWCIHANRIMGPITDSLDEYSYLIGGQFLYPWGCDSPRCAPGEMEYTLMALGTSMAMRYPTNILECGTPRKIDFLDRETDNDMGQVQP